MQTYLIRSIFALFLTLPTLAFTQCNKGIWEEFDAEGAPNKRHENAFVEINETLYLLGGRRINPVNGYNIKSNSWETLRKSPIELHHFQGIANKNEIWVIGAQTGKYPHEKPVEHIYAYAPKSDTWKQKDTLPKDRLRGAGGVCWYKDKVYWIGGIQDGHYDGHVKWFDCYDPTSKAWSKLPDMPRFRDHFSAVVIKDKLYCIGGRVTSKKTNKVFEQTVDSVDIFDFKTNEWHTAKQTIPTPRAGCMAVNFKHYVLVIGGESGAQKKAHNEVEAFNTLTEQFEVFPHLNTGRHGTQAINVKDKIYVASGSGNKGGGPELPSIEVYHLP